MAQGGSRVGTVLVPEIFGLNDYIKSVASELSKNGYWAAAVDVFHGKTPTTIEEGRKLRESMSREERLDALRSGLQLIKAKVGDRGKVGSMGFCMGGGFALLGACNLDFDFCIDYYGTIDDAEEVKGLRGPLQVILASEDERINTWVYQNLLPAVSKYKKRADLHHYPNAAHAFHRPNWPGYNRDAAKDAWQKTLDFIAAFH